MRTIKNLTHSYSDEGTTSKMIHLRDLRFMKDDLIPKIMCKYKPYANDMMDIKKEILNG